MFLCWSELVVHAGGFQVCQVLDLLAQLKILVRSEPHCHPNPSTLVAKSTRLANRVSPSTRAVHSDGRHKRMYVALGKSAGARSVDGGSRIKRVGVHDCNKREHRGDGGGERGEQREECGGADRGVKGALERVGAV